MHILTYISSYSCQILIFDLEIKENDCLGCSTTTFRQDVSHLEIEYHTSELQQNVHTWCSSIQHSVLYNNCVSSKSVFFTHPAYSFFWILSPTLDIWGGTIQPPLACFEQGIDPFKNVFLEMLRLCQAFSYLLVINGSVLSAIQ